MDFTVYTYARKLNLNFRLEESLNLKNTITRIKLKIQNFAKFLARILLPLAPSK